MSDYRERLVRFFEKHNPEKLSTVDTILAKYQGREVELFAALVAKYGPEPDSSTSDFRARLVRFFEHHNKEKLADVDTILTKYQGREPELIKALVAKYGPEPAEASPARSPAASSPPNSPAAAPVSEHRARLVRFFEKHNPEKLAEVDTILTKYKGREADLFKALVGKYGPEPDAGSSETRAPSASTENDFRARLVRFFEHHNKEKLADVDTILTKYQGREPELIKALVAKYGPEPAEASPTPSEGAVPSNSAPTETISSETPIQESVGGQPINELTFLLSLSGKELHEAIFSLARNKKISLEDVVSTIVPNKGDLLETFKKRWGGDWEGRVKRILVRYDPEQLSNVTALLKRSQGQEEKLISQLLTKYNAQDEPKFDAPTYFVKLTSRIKKDSIEDETVFTDDEVEETVKPPDSMFSAVHEAKNLQSEAEKVAAGECSGDDEHTYPRDEESWVRLRFDLTECDASHLEELREKQSVAHFGSRGAEDSEGADSPSKSSARFGQVTVCEGIVLDCYGTEKGHLCLLCSERVSKAFDSLWTPVGPQHRQAVLSSFVKEGYLDKLDRGGKWARRYFRAKDNGLHYFDSDKETEKPKPKGIKFFTDKSRIIEDVTTEEHKIKGIDPTKFYYFGVTVNHGEPYFLRTTSEAEKQSWVTFIKDALHRFNTSGGFKDPNPGRWRGRLEGIRKSSVGMAAEASDTSNTLFAIKKQLDAEREQLLKEEVSLARTQANEMSEQEVALQRMVEAAYGKLEAHRATVENRTIEAKAKCEAIALQRTQMQERLAVTQAEIEELKKSISNLHRKIIELEAEHQAEEAKCRKISTLFRRSEEKAKGAKLPSQVFMPIR